MIIEGDTLSFTVKSKVGLWIFREIGSDYMDFRENPRHNPGFSRKSRI